MYDNNNPLALAYLRKYLMQPEDIRKALDVQLGKKSMTDELLFIRRSRREIRTGDIFVVQPKPGVYFYGKVIYANIRSFYPDSWMNGNHLILIFQCRTNKLTIEDYRSDYRMLLSPPAVVLKECWTSGYFYTVGNIPLTEEERQLDYGLYDVIGRKFLKASGEELDHQPRLIGTNGVGSYGTIANEVKKELIMNPYLLEG